MWGDAAMDVRENIGGLHLHDEFRASCPAATACPPWLLDQFGLLICFTVKILFP